MFNAVVSGKATMEDVEQGRWKRIFPHKNLNIIMDGDTEVMDKSILINMVKERHEDYLAKQAL